MRKVNVVVNIKIETWPCLHANIIVSDVSEYFEHVSVGSFESMQGRQSPPRGSDAFSPLFHISPLIRKFFQTLRKISPI